MYASNTIMRNAAKKPEFAVRHSLKPKARQLRAISGRLLRSSRRWWLCGCASWHYKAWWKLKAIWHVGELEAKARHSGSDADVVGFAVVTLRLAVALRSLGAKAIPSGARSLYTAFVGRHTSTNSCRVV